MEFSKYKYAYGGEQEAIKVMFVDTTIALETVDSGFQSGEICAVTKLGGWYNSHVDNFQLANTYAYYTRQFITDCLLMDSTLKFIHDGHNFIVPEEMK